MKIVKRRIKSTTLVCKQGWECVGGRNFYFRSRWEVKVATWLETIQKGGQIANWDYEPQTFWFNEIKRGTRSYLPDFKVTRLDGSHYWIEVKGYMDAKSKTKLKRFKKYYPEEELQLITKDWFTKNLYK